MIIPQQYQLSVLVSRNPPYIMVPPPNGSVIPALHRWFCSLHTLKHRSQWLRANFDSSVNKQWLQFSSVQSTCSTPAWDALLYVVSLRKLFSLVFSLSNRLHSDGFLLSALECGSLLRPQKSFALVELFLGVWIFKYQSYWRIAFRTRPSSWEYWAVPVCWFHNRDLPITV